MAKIILHNSDCLEAMKGMPDESVQCVVTSPPYWGLRDYGVEGQLGLEKTPEEYVAKMVDVFREVRRVLKKDGVCWLNLGDSYCGGGRGLSEHNINFLGKGTAVSQGLGPALIPNGLKPKDIVGIPWRVAFALQADGWWLRQDIIWHKPNPMPESVTDRCTKAHEYIFLLTKSARYYWDQDAVKEDSIDSESFTGRRPRNQGTMNLNDPNNYKFHGSVNTDGTLKHGQLYEKRNLRSVWSITTQPTKEAHFATFPEKLVETCIKAG